MVKIVKEKEEVIIIGKSGTKTVMPNFEFAKQYARGTWKGSVKQIEVTTTYLVNDRKIFEKELNDVKSEIVQLESGRDNIGHDDVIDFINVKLVGLRRKKGELEFALELIDKN